MGLLFESRRRRDRDEGEERFAVSSLSTSVSHVPSTEHSLLLCKTGLDASSRLAKEEARIFVHCSDLSPVFPPPRYGSLFDPVASFQLVFSRTSRIAVVRCVSLRVLRDVFDVLSCSFFRRGSITVSSVKLAIVAGLTISTTHGTRK